MMCDDNRPNLLRLRDGDAMQPGHERRREETIVAFKQEDAAADDDDALSDRASNTLCMGRHVSAWEEEGEEAVCGPRLMMFDSWRCKRSRWDGRNHFKLGGVGQDGGGGGGAPGDKKIYRGFW